MPDDRQHRGPHPADGDLFGPDMWPALQQATAHLSWLMSRGYAWASALKLVGDRFRLTERQRTAVQRSNCSDTAWHRRRASRVPSDALGRRLLDIDGFNLLTTVEAALAGGVILWGRDDCARDMASMHGSYRKVAETEPALRLIGEVLEEFQPGPCRWWLDRPVSNSGRLSQMIRSVAAESGWTWDTELVADPDPILAASTDIVVTADSMILDACGAWTNLACEILLRRVPHAWVVPMWDDELSL